MYIIVVGAGRLGFHLAKILQEENHDVVVVEHDNDICQDLSNELEVVVIKGDATKPHILDEAGIREADALVALTGSDETNMIICLMAKQAGTKTVAARLSHLEYEEAVLQKLGIDLAIYPELAAAGYVAELLTKPEVLDMAFIGRGDAEILEVKVNEKSPMKDKMLKDVKLPEGTSVVGIYEKDNLMKPAPELVIKESDRVLVLSKMDKIKDLKTMLRI